MKELCEECEIGEDLPLSRLRGRRGEGNLQSDYGSELWGKCGESM